MSAKDLQRLLAEADARQGFPAGTMASVWKQETGGNSRYIDDPSAYHYAAGADGRRVAGHTGKVSTAFGPFGILESTARDPGYGVKPLASKDLDEQVRFASDYLAARSKGAGGLAGGLAGYGEGQKYAAQVEARRDGEAGISRGTRRPQPGATPVVPADPAPTVLAAASDSPEVNPPVQLEAPPVQVAAVNGDQEAWSRFLALQAQAPAPVQQPQVDMAQQLAAIGQVDAPMFQVAPVAPRAIDFRTFGKWGQA